MKVVHSNGAHQLNTIHRTAGPEIDPIGDVVDGVKDFFSKGWEEGTQFVGGAVPLYGAKRNGELWIQKAWSGNNSGSRMALGGAVANAAGSISLAAGVYLAATGSDPTVAYVIAGGLLGVSGVISAAVD